MAAEKKGLQQRQGTRSGRGHRAYAYAYACASRSSSGLGSGALDGGDAQSSQVDWGLWRGLLRVGCSTLL